MQDARECKPIVRRRLSMDDLPGEPRGSAIPSRGDASKAYPFVAGCYRSGWYAFVEPIPARSGKATAPDGPCSGPKRGRC